MAAQSFAMGHAFGTSFQYGKRKISSMTNEEFNALSATDLHGELQADIRAMIPNMNESFKTMEQFQIDIINSMVNTLKLAGEQFFEWLTTGKVTPQISTSAIDFGEGGEVTYVQGGSRQETPGSYIPQYPGQSYQDYLNDAGIVQEKNVQRRVTQQKYAKEIRQAPAFEKLKPIEKVDTQRISQSRRQYDNLIKIRDTAGRMAKAFRILVNKYKQLLKNQTRGSRGSLNTNKQLKRYVSRYNDAVKKQSDAIRLLRNFRGGRPR